MELDCHLTSLTKAPSITQAIKTEVHNESNARKKAQTASREDKKNLLPKAEGVFEPIRSPSMKEMFVQKKDETWALDQSLTLVVDDDDYEQEKVVEVKAFLSLFLISASDN